jgi:hypothetical protein
MPLGVRSYARSAIHSRYAGFVKPGLRRRRALSSAALLLAVFGFLFAAAAFQHTDDGCEVEIHCLPCRWHQGATVVFALVPQPTLPVDLGSADVPSEPRRVTKGAPLQSGSRAPPLA